MNERLVDKVLEAYSIVFDALDDDNLTESDPIPVIEAAEIALENEEFNALSEHLSLLRGMALALDTSIGELVMSAQKVKASRPAYPIRRVEIILHRRGTDDISDKRNDEETALVHALAATFPKEVQQVNVCDCGGEFLYYADGREG